jgi:hypothetical protein
MPPSEERRAHRGDRRHEQGDARPVQQPGKNVAAITVGVKKQKGRAVVRIRSHEMAPGEPAERNRARPVFLERPLAQAENPQRVNVGPP